MLALILAIVIWAIAIRLNDPVEGRTLEVVVEVVGKPADATIVEHPPESVLVTFQGPVSALEQLSPGDFSATIDLSSVPFGDSVAPIRVAGGNELIELMSVFPESAQLKLEQIVTRDIPVFVQVRGEVARGHRVGEARLAPETVQVTGPADRVERLAEGRVIVFVDNEREDLSDLRRPTFYDTQGDVASVVGLTLNPTEVEVIVPVQELAGFAEKPVTVNWVGEPATGYRLLDVRVEPSSVQATGASGILEGLRIQTEPIDITGLTETTVQQVALDLPEGIGLVEIQPLVVTVEIEPILTSSVVQKPVEIRALGENLKATLEPDEVRVFLFGPIPKLDSLLDDDVRVTVDLLNLITGTHVVEPFVSVSADGVEVRSTQPSQITVIISATMTETNELGLPETALGNTLLFKDLLISSYGLSVDYDGPFPVAKAFPASVQFSRRGF